MIHLIKKHPFFNANKRTAMMAADIFLQVIDIVLRITGCDDNQFDYLKSEISQMIAHKLRSLS